MKKCFYPTFTYVYKSFIMLRKNDSRSRFDRESIGYEKIDIGEKRMKPCRTIERDINLLFWF